MQKKKYTEEIKKQISLDYLLHLPKTYSEDLKAYPLLLFLHGRGERGETLEILKRTGLPAYIEQREEFPFVTVMPQCPKTTFWPMLTEKLYYLVKKIMRDYRIDSNRVYLTGLSMGGYGCWHLANEYPDIFAAMIPICGGTFEKIGFPERIKNLKNLPIWTFHGKKDSVVPIEKTQELVQVLQRVNGNINFTVYPEGTHNIWDETYANEEIYRWLLRHTR